MLRSVILKEEPKKPKPPFNSKLERDCNKTLEKIENIGPGAYIDINDPHNSSLNKTLLRFSSDRQFKLAYGIDQSKPFGSTTERFIKKQDNDLWPKDPPKDFGLASTESL